MFIGLFVFYNLYIPNHVWSTNADIVSIGYNKFFQEFYFQYYLTVILFVISSDSHQTHTTRWTFTEPGLHLHPSISALQSYYYSCHTNKYLSSEYTIRYLIRFSAVFDWQFFNRSINTVFYLSWVIFFFFFTSPFSKFIFFSNTIHLSSLNSVICYGTIYDVCVCVYEYFFSYNIVIMKSVHR